MIAALWSAFILPLTWVEVSGSFFLQEKFKNFYCKRNSGIYATANKSSAIAWQVTI